MHTRFETISIFPKPTNLVVPVIKETLPSAQWSGRFYTDTTKLPFCHFLHVKEIPVFKVILYYIRVVFKHDPRKKGCRVLKKWKRTFSGGPML